MTDKQIIDSSDICKHCGAMECKEHRCKIYNIVEAVISSKEQECERLKEENFTFEQLIKEIEKYGAIEEIIQQLDQVKAELQTEKDWHKTADEIAKKNSEYANQLKAENEELKEFQKLLKGQMEFNKNELELNWSSEIKRSEFLLNEFKKADKQRDEWREKAEKYFKALTEIKEIAEKSYRTPLAEKDCIKCDEFLEQILQKISECEVTND